MYDFLSETQNKQLCSYRHWSLQASKSMVNHHYNITKLVHTTFALYITLLKSYSSPAWEFSIALNLNLVNFDQNFDYWDSDAHPSAAWSPSWLCPGLLRGYWGSYNLPDQHWLDWYRCWSSEIWIGITERPGHGCPAQRPSADWSSPPALTNPSSLASERQSQFIADKTW